MKERCILHCDLNNFYASVECLLNPSLKGYCIAVCGDRDVRHGIILAKSNEAKKMGVKDCYEPFMTPAFLSLAVIPALKLTDRGLFDVTKFEFTTVEVMA